MSGGITVNIDYDELKDNLKDAFNSGFRGGMEAAKKEEIFNEEIDKAFEEFLFITGILRNV